MLLPAEGLKRLGTGIFASLGAPRETAEFVAGTLVEASLTGHDSHGVLYFVTYAERIKRGFIDVKAKPEVAKETAASALIDGRWAFGQVTAMRAMELAVKKAGTNVVAAVGCYNCNHIGRVGYYADWAARQGVVGTMFVNVGNSVVTAHGGTGRLLGTNPFSAAAPRGGSEPFLLDYATSVVAEGKVKVALAKGERIPRHWIRDRHGGETDDPRDLFDGGWLLPFGEHKGYALHLLMELLGGVLTGSRSGADPGAGPPSANGVLAICIDPEGFVGREAFARRSEAVLGWVKAAPPRAGSRVLIPGEPEQEARERRRREGIPVPEETWGQIARLAEELGVDHSYL